MKSCVERQTFAEMTALSYDARESCTEYLLGSARRLEQPQHTRPLSPTHSFWGATSILYAQNILRRASQWTSPSIAQH
jgi:hypothetical protein